MNYDKFKELPNAGGLRKQPAWWVKWVGIWIDVTRAVQAEELERTARQHTNPLFGPSGAPL